MDFEVMVDFLEDMIIHIVKEVNNRDEEILELDDSRLYEQFGLDHENVF